MVQRVFCHADQLAFAEFSGDYNPLHVDPIAARRLLFGEQVVHGIHLALWGLDRWLERRNENVRLSSLTCDFSKPLGLDKVVRHLVFEERENPTIIELES